MSRHLITTSDERTWKNDRPALFLGDWCRLYSRRSAWEKMDAIVAEPFGLEPGRKQRDLAYVHGLADRIVDELAEPLNTIHETTHGPRYWRIVLGHWVQRYVAMMFNRYFSLEQALAQHAVSGVTFLHASPDILAQPDSLASIWAYDDPVFNGLIYENILRAWGFAGIEPISEFVPEAQDIRAGRSRTQSSHGSQRVKPLILDVARRILPLFSRPTDAVILKSYLPKIKEVALQLALGQCPQSWHSPRLQPVEPNRSWRSRMSFSLERHVGFELHVRAQIPNMLPTVYLEGYNDLVRRCDLLKWPRQPKFVFTSNSFDTDETFKCWAASKVEEGFPYFVGQHGNNYGTLLGYPNWPELVTSDRFFSWGWTDGNKKTVPAFVFKSAGRSRKRSTPRAGSLLLVEVHQPHRLTPWDSYFEHAVYQEEQFRFVDSLSPSIRRELIVRLHGGHREFNWSDAERWKNTRPDVKVDSGSTDIRKLIDRCRLVVHSYDSTGILETLAANVPTLCFWNGGTDHLVPSAKHYYELLRSVGILHPSPESAAQAVAEHWAGLREWWERREVQNARTAFCNRYARVSLQPVRKLRHLLTTHASEVSAAAGSCRE